MNDHVAYIALGSNLGDRLAALRHALGELKRAEGIAIDPRGVASLWETEPVGGAERQTDFYNSAVRVSCRLEPQDLLNTLMDVEQRIGRTRRVLNESRIIDLDLLLFDDLQCADAFLTLPHPRLHERRFVLEPLAEIGRDKKHPFLNRTIGDLCDELRRSPTPRVTRIAGPQWADETT